MNLEDQILAKVSGVQSLSSSVQSTPEKNGHSDEASRSPELLQESLKPVIKNELLQTCFEKEKKKRKMIEPRPYNKTPKVPDPRKAPGSWSSRKQPRKGENPVRLTPTTNYNSLSWICKNSACRAVLSGDDTFCKRCSCCICHLFDDNKDPSLWLVCSSDCEMSCHIECALLREKVGVVNLGQLMHLDGSYCCAYCGKVSGILDCWKKQLIIAKEARRIDVLCYRVSLSYRLLKGTSRYKDVHEIVVDLKSKLEMEVGPMDGVSAKMARGIASRLSVASDVNRLCSLAIQKADAAPDCSEDSVPAACRFLFEEVSSSHVTIILIEVSTPANIKSYKLWYCKTREEPHQKDPVCIFPRTQRRILISSLNPCTEYTFRIVSCTEDGDLGHSESKCFTKSVEIILPKPGNPDLGLGSDSSVKREEVEEEGIGGFKVRDLGKMVRLNRAKEAETLTLENKLSCPPPPRVPVPDLNEDLTLNSSDDDVASHGTRKKTRSSKRGNDESESTLIDGSPLRGDQAGGSLDENFEYCVKVIRLLECEGHIKQEFRLKLLTWFSLRSTEQERRVVNTFIRTLVDDPCSLAGQLVDSFSDLVLRKKARNGFCTKLWH